MKKLNYWAAAGIIDKVYCIDTLEYRIEKILNISIDDIKSRTRVREVSEARQILFFVLNKFFGIPLSHIGRMYERNHATVIHAIKNVTNWRQTDQLFRDKSDRILRLYN